MKRKLDTKPEIDYKEDEVNNNFTQSTQSAISKTKLPYLTSASAYSNIKPFRNGSIKKVRLTNFMIHKFIEFYPTSGLNLIVGPNGSGKSCIICAICLGLNGKTESLGRGKELSDFIIRDQEVSETIIEITIVKDNVDHVIKRIIRRDKKRNEWWLDNKQTIERDISAFIYAFNIQVDNLCQFLAQDRVASFAKMGPTELLMATEMAVDENLYKQHKELIDLRKNEKEHAQLKINLESQLANARATQADNERDKLRFEERQRNEEKAETLGKLLLWQKTRDATNSYNELDTSVKAKENELLSSEVDLKPIREKIEKLKSQQSTLGSEIDRTKKDKIKFDQKKEEFGTLLGELESTVSEVYADKEEFDDNLKHKQTELTRLQKSLANDEERLAHLKPEQELRAEMAQADGDAKELYKEMEDINTNITRISDQLDSIVEDKVALTKELNLVMDKRVKHRESVYRFRPQIKPVLDFINNNQNKFKASVFGPIVCEVSVPNKFYADVLENILGEKNLYAFVVQCAEDSAILSKFIHEKKYKSPVIQVNMDTQTQSHYHPAEFLKKYGVAGYLDDLIDCNPQIRKVLKDLVRTHHVGVGLKITKIEEILVKDRDDFHGLEMLAGNNQMYRAKVSKYSNQTSTNVSHLRDHRIILIDNNSAETQPLNDRIREIEKEEVKLVKEREKLQKEYTSSRLKWETAKSLKNTCAQNIKDHSQIQKNITHHNTNIQKITSSIAVEMSKGTKFASRISAGNLNRLNAYKDLLKFINSKVESRLTNDAAAFQLSKNKSIISCLERQLELKGSRSQNLQNEILRMKDELVKLTTMRKALLAKAKAEAPLNVWTAKFEEYNALTTEQVENEIFQARRTAEAIDPNPDALIAYRKLQETIATLTEQLDNELRVYGDAYSRLNENRTRWESSLEEHISKIDKQFIRYFTEMGCNGTIELRKHEDFDKYGVDIKVTFRPGSSDLQLLSSNVQSGGEKSVATMLYLLSLQKISDCPFRVVDEINQGMDATNERTVFELIVKTSQINNLPQYFVVTPKLLPDLPYPNDASVLFVFNGVYWKKQPEINLEELVAANAQRLKQRRLLKNHQ